MFDLAFFKKLQQSIRDATSGNTIIYINYHQKFAQRKHGTYRTKNEFIEEAQSEQDRLLHEHVLNEYLPYFGLKRIPLSINTSKANSRNLFIVD